MFDSLLQDARYAFRMLRTSPSFTVVTVFILALGIGGNTAIFSALDAVLFRNLPVHKPHQLVAFSNTLSQGWVSDDGPPGRQLYYFSYPLYSYFRDNNKLFQDICAFRSSRDDLTVRAEGARSDADVRIATGKEVSGNYFSVLGVSAILGRTLTPADDQPEAPPAVVISYHFWSNSFNRDPSVLGRVLHVNSISFSIVGVTPQGFFGERVESNPADLWLPLALQPRLMRQISWLGSANVYWLGLIGRLNPNIDIKQAEAAVNVQVQQFFLAQTGSPLSAKTQRDIQASQVHLVPGGRGISILRRQYSEPLHVLMAIVIIILFIACANVAGLLLVRGTAREREIAVRSALGADRRRLVRQILTESLILAALGATFGGLFAGWGVTLLRRLVIPNTPIDVTPDWNVFLFTLGVSVISGMTFGVLPAVRITRVDLTSTLKASGLFPGAERPHPLKLAKALVIFQIACALTLMTGAGLLVRSFQILANQDLGFDPDRVLLVGIDAKLAGYEPKQLGAFYKRVLDRVATLPGVSSVSLARYSPLSGTNWSQDITVQGYTSPDQDMNVTFDAVGPRYFETEGIPFLLGRPIIAEDVKGSSEVAVVNQAFVRSFFPNVNPVGRHFRFGGENPLQNHEVEIVGVVKDAKFFALREEPEPMVFISVFQTEGELAYQRSLEIRAAGDPRSIAEEVRQTISELDKNLPIMSVLTLREQIQGRLNNERITSELSGFFSMLALLLAGVGLYGLMSYLVVRRTSEIGIRIALGAGRGTVMRLILGQGAFLAFIGVMVGLGASFALMRLISSLLYGVGAHDPFTFAIAAILLTLIALIACYIPARRAMRVDPIVSVRYE